MHVIAAKFLKPTPSYEGWDVSKFSSPACVVWTFAMSFNTRLLYHDDEDDNILLVHQVGINVLGVLENMSELKESVAAMSLL